jgi:short-subunit dehydrogenase
MLSVAMEHWALITGASAGIGRELADIFAANGFNLVLVARDQERLSVVAKELGSRNKIEVKVLAYDLSRPGAAAAVFESLKQTPVSVLVNNAGFGSYGPFVESDLEIQTGMMQVNMIALVQLTHLFVQPMRERRQGRILNVASTAGFQPGPMLNVYYATKAFVFSFSYALADELRGTGVTVTVLCPGLTQTEFQKRANLREGGPWIMSARAVAEAGYRGVMRGQRVVIPGVFNQVGSFLARRVPFRLTSAIVRRIHKARNAVRA